MAILLKTSYGFSAMPTQIAKTSVADIFWWIKIFLFGLPIYSDNRQIFV